MHHLFSYMDAKRRTTPTYDDALYYFIATT